MSPEPTEYCTWGAAPPYLNTCEQPAEQGTDQCTYHNDTERYLEELAASMPDDFDVSVDDAPNPYEPDVNDPAFIAHQGSLHIEAYVAWRRDRLADDPELSDDEVSLEAYEDDLVAHAEARADGNPWSITPT